MGVVVMLLQGNKMKAIMLLLRFLGTQTTTEQTI